MTRIVLAIAALAMGLGVAQADGPHEGRFNWSGLYIGAHAGYGSGDWNVDLSHSTGAIFYSDPFKAPHQSLSANDGALGGLQAGFNRQLGVLVVGMEADVSWASMSAEGTFTTPLGSQWDIKSEIDMLGTVRGRIGMATGPLLFYATGGLAWAEIDTTQATHFVDGKGKIYDEGGRTSGSNHHFGWVAGGGVEWMVMPNWTVRGEYLYYDLGSVDYGLRGTTKPDGKTLYVETFSSDMQFHVVRGAISYKF